MKMRSTAGTVFRARMAGGRSRDSRKIDMRANTTL
jgi:hypothetical protein